MIYLAYWHSMLSGVEMIFGIRCSNTDYAYALLSSRQSSPIVHEANCVPFPQNYSRGETLHWFAQELRTIAQNHQADAWIIKRSEPLARKNKAHSERIEQEAIAQLVAQERGIASIACKTKATIAKDLGLPGKPKSLDTQLDTSRVDGYDSYNDKIKEAILAAWSQLP